MTYSEGAHPTVCDIYRRYLHAATVEHAARTQGMRDMWFGIAHAYRESARMVARDVIGVREVARRRRAAGR